MIISYKMNNKVIFCIYYIINDCLYITYKVYLNNKYLIELFINKCLLNIIIFSNHFSTIIFFVIVHSNN